MVFSIADSGAAYVHPGLNISDEVVKRLDAAAREEVVRVRQIGFRIRFLNPDLTRTS